MKHLKQRSHFTVKSHLLQFLCCENEMRSKLEGVQRWCCNRDHGCNVSQNCCHIILKWKKTCSQTSCTVVYNQYEFLNKVILSHCSADVILMVVFKRPRGAVTAVLPQSVASWRFTPLFLSFICTDIKMRVSWQHAYSSRQTLSVAALLTQCKWRTR